MRKWISVLLVCVALLHLTSCKKNIQADFDNNLTIESDKLLTHSYPLADLENFIKDRNSNKRYRVFEKNEPTLLFYNELNEKFPIEVLKYGDERAYTVYRVEEGGYYYVFWSHAYPSGGTPCDGSAENVCTDTEHMIVYFSAYLGSYVKALDIFFLRKNMSTAKDVMMIDPNLEFVSFSRGYVSYSLLNKTMILEVWYTYTYSEDMDYSDLIIKDFNIYPINKSESCFRDVAIEDMP